MLTSIQGKTVIVTGGSKGIGKGIASVFAKQGAKVMIAARGESAAKEAIEEIKTAGGTAEYYLCDVSNWEQVQALVDHTENTFGPVDLIPQFEKLGKGRVVVTSSITGPITGYPGWAHYGATKAGQLGFMKTAAMELARYNTTINAVMPGNIVTEGLASLGEDYLNSMAAAIPLKRLGAVEDIANAALFFASDEAAYITGQQMVIDGGQTLPECVEAVDEI